MDNSEAFYVKIEKIFPLLFRARWDVFVYVLTPFSFDLFFQNLVEFRLIRQSQAKTQTHNEDVWIDGGAEALLVPQPRRLNVGEM